MMFMFQQIKTVGKINLRCVANNTRCQHTSNAAKPEPETGKGSSSANFYFYRP